MPRTIVITGASSGIGEALALAYARDRGCLGLLGRSRRRLDRIAERCRAAGAAVSTATIDVRDRPDMADWLGWFDDQTPIDLLIANAGVMAGSAAAGEIEPSEAAYELMQTNVLGVLNSIQPVVPRMIARRRGQIGIVSSIGAFVPLADAPSYGASKAALLSYGLALRSLLASQGIAVSVICPGYVATPMMRQESGPKPFVMPPDQAAARIRRGLARDRAVITFPTMFGLLTRIGGLLPDRLRHWTAQSSRFTVSERSGLEDDA
jgi:short-subunit dehydrogenase